MSLLALSATSIVKGLGTPLVSPDFCAKFEYYEYQGQVRQWVKAQLTFSIDETTLQTLVDDAFMKMQRTFTRYPEKFADYPNLAALLGLLRLCARRGSAGSCDKPEASASRCPA